MLALLAEDDQDLGETLKQILEEDGFHVDWAKTGSEAVYLVEDFEYDILILDRMLPEKDGITVLEELRTSSSLPVLMLTASNQLEDRVSGLNAGADDYLGKPFELPELLARIRTLLRRAPQPVQEQVVHRDLVLEPFRQRVLRKGEPVHLSKTEYRAVEFLIRRRDRIIRREQLERLLYDQQDIQSNPVDVLIHRIRKKLGDDFVRTQRGQGFIVESETSS